MDIIGRRIKYEELINKQYGLLTIKEIIKKDGVYGAYAICECNCQDKTIKTASLYNILSGATRSCGCLYRKRKGMSASLSYGTWRNMINRCYDKDNKAYPHYGERGITVCERWKDREKGFFNFLEDMGERIKGFSIDRKDNDGSYCKDNCRWATSKEQNRNLSINVLITYNGETKTLPEWAEQYGISPHTFRTRYIRDGLPMEQCISKKRVNAKKGS